MSSSSFTTHTSTRNIYIQQHAYSSRYCIPRHTILLHMYKTTYLLVSFDCGNDNTKVVVVVQKKHACAGLGEYNSTLQLVIGSSSHRFHSLSSSLFTIHHLMRLLVLLVSITCLLGLVLAGPGTHRYEQPGHSNYGDDKTNQQ